MAKVKSSDILKPGAELKVIVIDWARPEVKRMAAMCKKSQLDVLRMGAPPSRETLSQEITNFKYWARPKLTN